MKNMCLAILIALCPGAFISTAAFGQDDSKEVLKNLDTVLPWQDRRMTNINTFHTMNLSKLSSYGQGLINLNTEDY